MEYIEVSPLPAVCRRCEDRRSCLEKNEPEWCCDECDYLLERFVPAAADAKNGAVSKGCLRQPRAHNTWAYKSTFSNRAADFR